MRLRIAIVGDYPGQIPDDLRIALEEEMRKHCAAYGVRVVAVTMKPLTIPAKSISAALAAPKLYERHQSGTPTAAKGC